MRNRNNLVRNSKNLIIYIKKFILNNYFMANSINLNPTKKTH